MGKQQTGSSAGNPKIDLPHFIVKRLTEGSFILVLTAAFYVLLSLVTYKATDPGWSHANLHSSVILNAGGQVGAYVADSFYWVFGFWAYLLPVCFAYLSWVILMDYRVLRVVHRPVLLLRSVGLLLLLTGGCGLLSLEVQHTHAMSVRLPGGVLGQSVASVCIKSRGCFFILILDVTRWRNLVNGSIVGSCHGINRLLYLDCYPCFFQRHAFHSANDIDEPGLYQYNS